LLENGKKRTFSYKVAEKNFHGRAKGGGIAPCPPKYATGSDSISVVVSRAAEISPDFINTGCAKIMSQLVLDKVLTKKLGTFFVAHPVV